MVSSSLGFYRYTVVVSLDNVHFVSLTSHLQDYPSVGQIVQMLHEKDVTVIFAIDPERIETYQVRDIKILCRS